MPGHPASRSNASMSRLICSSAANTLSREMKSQMSCKSSSASGARTYPAIALPGGSATQLGTHLVARNPFARLQLGESAIDLLADLRQMLLPQVVLFLQEP